MSLLLRCQQEKKELRALRPLTRMLSVQTSLAIIPNTSGAGTTNDKTKNSFAAQTASFASLGWVTGPPASQSDAEARSTDMDIDAEPDRVASDASLQVSAFWHVISILTRRLFSGNEDSGDIIPELGTEPAPVVPSTP
jgi:hypothetical protein